MKYPLRARLSHVKLQPDLVEHLVFFKKEFFFVLLEPFFFELLNGLELRHHRQKLFEALLDAQRELSILTDAETFIYSFRLGAKIMMDVLVDSAINEI